MFEKKSLHGRKATFAFFIFFSLTFLIFYQAAAVSTRRFVLDDAATLGAGKLEGTKVLSNGSIMLGVEARRFAMENTPIAYSVVRDSRGHVFVGTGNNGKVYRLQGDQLSVFAETGALLVSALAMSPDGTLYAGTLASGVIFAIDAQGHVREFAKPEHVQHVWALVYDAQRKVLIAGTGPEGHILTIDTAGHIAVTYDSDASHVMSLALDGDGSLYAGTSDQALLLRLRAGAQPEVVFDFPGNELTSIDVVDGRILVAANEFPDPPPVPSPPNPRAGPTSQPPPLPSRPRPGKGRLWRVSSDGLAEEVLRNDETHFTAVSLAKNGSAYVATGKDGRIHEVLPDQTHSIWMDVDERQITALDFSSDESIFVTGDSAAVYRVLPPSGGTHQWTSKVLDAETVARWGTLVWRGQGAFEFQTRSGNTAEPNASWSEWSALTTSPGPIRSVAAHFLQLRMKFPNEPNAVLYAVTAFYVPQNRRALVANISAKRKAPPAPTDAAGKTAAVVSDDPPAPTTVMTVTWKTENPDNDPLRYRLRYRNESQDVWRSITLEETVLTQSEYNWDIASLPDGYYVVEVDASDELANPPAFALRFQGESEPVLVDHHPPHLDGLAFQGGRVVGTAVDSWSAISKLDFSVDGAPWTLLAPEDGVLDELEETFQIETIRGLRGSHVIAVRATDAAGNMAIGELMW